MTPEPGIYPDMSFDRYLAAELRAQTAEHIDETTGEVIEDEPAFDIDGFAKKLGADMKSVVSHERAVSLRIERARVIEDHVRPISADRADKMLAALDAKVSEMEAGE